VRRNKYGAIKVKADGITFDSKLEHKRYQELKLLEKAGEITSLMVHKRWPLYSQVSNAPIDSCDTLVGHYESDFNYRDDGKLIVEDCKGVVTPLSAWKIKHFGIQHGVKVRIIRK
jgi:hypothetical protein